MIEAPENWTALIFSQGRALDRLEIHWRKGSAHYEEIAGATNRGVCSENLGDAQTLAARAWAHAMFQAGKEGPRIDVVLLAFDGAGDMLGRVASRIETGSFETEEETGGAFASEASSLAARRLAAWRREPWRCLGCGGENIRVRAQELPGGPPGNVRRDASARWESRCDDCGLQWTAVYSPDRLEVHRTAIGLRFLGGDA